MQLEDSRIYTACLQDICISSNLEPAALSATFVQLLMGFGSRRVVPFHPHKAEQP